MRWFILLASMILFGCTMQSDVVYEYEFSIVGATLGPNSNGSTYFDMGVVNGTRVYSMHLKGGPVECVEKWRSQECVESGYEDDKCGYSCYSILSDRLEPVPEITAGMYKLNGKFIEGNARYFDVVSWEKI